MRFIIAILGRTWLVALIAVLACGGFAARAVAAYASAPQDADRAIPPPPRAERPAPKPPTDPNVVEARNIFCSACAPELPAAGAYAGHAATLIAISRGASSHATVRVIPTDVQGSWELDDTIPGVGRIARIGNTSIDVVDSAGRTKRLALDEPATGHTVDAATLTGPVAAATDPFADRVSKRPNGSYDVDRGVVRELVSSGGRNAGVQAMPVMHHGEIAGLRLSGVRSTSIAAALGLQSGDVLSTIDGEPIKTMQQVLDLYGNLDKLGGIEIQGVRGGKPLRVDLRFR